MPSKKVLLISIDNLRYDCVGYAKNRPHLEKFSLHNAVDTPTINEIASNSAVFTNCFSTNTYTTSAHASLFTGLYPPNHGIRAFYKKKLKKDLTTLAEVYKNNGYKTVFCSDLPELFEPLGMAKGFDYKIERNDLRLLELLLNLKDEKVFCFIHFYDVHDPYIYSECPPDKSYNNSYFDFISKMAAAFKIAITEKEPHKMYTELLVKVKKDIRFFLSPYIFGVNKFDKGRFNLMYKFLKNLGYFDEENVYSILSDHGEGRILLNDQPFFSHGGELFDEVIHIPLVFHAPGIENKPYDNLTSIVDIYPTIIKHSGLNLPPANIDGQSLFEKRDYCYSEHFITKLFDDTIKGLSGDDYGNPVLPRSSFKDEILLCQRSVRSCDDNKKYVFMPFPSSEDIDKIMKDMKDAGVSDEDYLKSLYRVLFGRFEEKENFLMHLKRLKDGTISRSDLYNLFISHSEYKRPKNYYYDLIGDPLEEKPAILDLSSPEAVKYMNILNELENKAVITEDTFEDNTGTAASDRSGLLNAKISFSIDIIKEAYERFGEAMGIAFTGGKDSTVLLYLVKTAFGGVIPFKVINIDSTADFPEIYEFKDRLKKEWNFDLRVYRNEEALKSISIAKEKAECCNLLKTAPLKNAIADLNLKALMTGVRKDEQEFRSKEVYFSKRENPEHYRIHPILHFTEADIWEYIRSNNIPYCPLYDTGYRSLDCVPCTKKSEAGGPERSGRSKDKEAIMDKLRTFGYF